MIRIDYPDLARQYILEKNGNNVSLLTDSVVDSERFYCFTFQSNDYIKTGNPLYMFVGHGYTIIHKEDGRFFEFGSGHSPEESIKILEKKLSVEKRIRNTKPQFDMRIRYDLRINSIGKRQLLTDALLASKITYILPEIVAGSVFRIPKLYNSSLLNKTLNDLPVVFHGVGDGLQLIDALLASGCCEFDLVEHQEKNLAKYADKATGTDLQPIW